MPAVMVPDLYPSTFASGGVPFAQPACDQHTKTLDAIWRRHASQTTLSESTCQQLTPSRLWSGADVCTTRSQVSNLPPAQPNVVPGQTALYPGRAMQVQVSNRPVPKPDLTAPLFVDTTVEYDLPKEAYPPQNSAPLLIVHPQYYEYLRHQRVLGAGCTCQLCSFYGRQPATTAQCSGAAAASPSRVQTSTAELAPAVETAAPVFQRPVWPSTQQFQQQQQQQQKQQQQQSVYINTLLLGQRGGMAAVQQSHPQLLAQQQQRRQASRVEHCAPAPRYSCLLERPATFVTPPISCDSDSGYSSVELDPAEWSSGCRHQQQRLQCWCRGAPAVAADASARDVMAKRKRRHDGLTGPAAPDSACKRPRPAPVAVQVPCALWREHYGCAV